jgi:hypothetical protein
VSAGQWAPEAPASRRVVKEPRMRTVFTALAFLVMFMAVLPAVQRSLRPTERHTDPPRQGKRT